MTPGLQSSDGPGDARMRDRAEDNAEIHEVETLSENHHPLRKYRFAYRRRDGTRQELQREVYGIGHGAAVLPLEPRRSTVLLTRQFRLPAYLNGHPDGMLVEAPAGLLDGEDPETAIRREAEEETGYRVEAVTRLGEFYMSPGSVTERLHFFAAPYSGVTRSSAGGGLAHEGEDIEVLELPFDEALDRIGRDIVDAKTIMLLQWAALKGPFAAG